MMYDSLNMVTDTMSENGGIRMVERQKRSVRRERKAETKFWLQAR
jgi:hypothetical protein